MIVVRRALTVPLAIVLTLALLLTLVAHRANATVLSAGFYQEQLAEVGVFEAVHDEVLPNALDDFLAEQTEKLPDNLEGVTLPTDAASREAILDFARTMLPPAYLEHLTTEGIDAMLAYLTGDADELSIPVSLNEPMTAAFLASEDAPSEFERTWTELDLTNTVFAGLARSVQIPELDALQHPLSRPVLTRLRAEGMPLEDATALVATIYEAEPVDHDVARITENALGGNATIEELEDLKTLLVVTRAIDPEPAQRLVDAVAMGAQPGDDLLTLLLGPDRDEAITWFEAELFAAVRDLSAYLVGDADHFAIQIDFGAYPELAAVVAGPLNSDPETLLRDGFRLNDVDIQRELDAAEDPPVESLEDIRALFTPAGRTFGIEDFGPSDEEPAPAAQVTAAPAGAGADAPATSEGGLDLERIRPVTAALATWARSAGVLAVLLLATTIGFLGGRQWWSRASWAAAGLAGPALLIAIAAGPVYSAAAAPALEAAVGDRQAELLADEGATTDLAIRALDQVEVVANAQARALATNAAVVMLLALLAGSAAVAWRVYEARRNSEPLDTAGAADLLALPFEVTELTELSDVAPDDDARAA